MKKVLITLGTAAGMVASTLVMAPDTKAMTVSLNYGQASPTFWGTNGRVTSAVLAGNDVYIGGDFDYIGPQTGHGATVDAAFGRRASTVPVINGPVYASAPDGSGGWFVGGKFTYVGGAYHPYAAHINSAGKVLSWNPKPNGQVNAIAVVGGNVVLGGTFTQILQSGTAVSRVAAVSPSSGAVIRGWSGGANGTVNALLPSPKGLYVGGSFTQVDGINHAGLARIRPTTGAFDGTWTGAVQGTVNTISLSPDGSTVYAGGAFGTAGTATAHSARGNLAAFAGARGVLTSWAPATNGTVKALAVDPASGTVYAGGKFQSISGAPRSDLAGIGRKGAVTAFDGALNGCHIAHYLDYRHTDVPCSPEVDSLSVRNGKLYVGGLFGYSGTIQRHNAVAFPLGTSVPSSWNPVASDKVLTLSQSGSSTFLGGNLTSVNGMVRSGIAGINATTGVGDPAVRADTNNLVLALVASADGSRVYAAGSFTTVGGLSRTSLVAVDTSTGNVDPNFVANTNGQSYALAFGGNALYAGGKYTEVNGVARVNMVKVDPATGTVDRNFIANTTGPTGLDYRDGMVEGLAVTSDGRRVFMAGAFTTLNSAGVNGGLAVVNGATAAMLPNQLGGVRPQCSTSIGKFITFLVLSSDDQRLYGGGECPDYLYQWNASTLSTPSNPTGLNWWTWCDGGMQGGVEANGRFYDAMHGKVCWASPTDHTRQIRTRYAVFDSATGALESDAATIGSPMGVFAVLPLRQGLLMGGDFADIQSRQSVAQGLALIPDAR